MPTPCTITLDLKLDDDVGNTAQMAEAIQMLTDGVGTLPCNGMKIAFVTADEQGAEKLEAFLELLLQDRAYGVVAEITRKSKRGLLRKMPPPPPTPIEREIARAQAATDAEVISTGPRMLEADAVVLTLQAPLATRILEELTDAGALSTPALAARLGEPVDAIVPELHRLRDEGKIDLDSGSWFIAEGSAEGSAA